MSDVSFMIYLILVFIIIQLITLLTKVYSININEGYLDKNNILIGGINDSTREEPEEIIYNKPIDNQNNLQGSLVRITHSSGFFSCCSVKLSQIVEFINLYKKLPDKIDSSQQFTIYKYNTDRDITYDYFKHYDNTPNIKITLPIKYHWNDQFLNYSNLDYDKIRPLIHKYFSPSIEIENIIVNIENKYNLNYDNTCVLFYRGNDKNRETKKCSYDEYLIYAEHIRNIKSDIKFLIQSDETEFIEFMTNKFPHCSFYLKEEIRHIKKNDDTVDNGSKYKNYEFSKKFLAITIIMSKCKYIICGSGNCDIWIMLYRGNNHNTIQNLNGTWFT